MNAAKNLQIPCTREILLGELNTAEVLKKNGDIRRVSGYEHRNSHSVLIKGTGFLDSLSKYHSHKKKFVPRSTFIRVF